jgi:hypothetical protein
MPIHSLAAPATAIVKELDPPNPVFIDGDKHFYYTSYSPDLGEVTVQDIPGKTISQVQIWDADTNVYMSTLKKKSGNTYNLGKVKHKQKHDLKYEFPTGQGYFAWFRASERKELWAYDLDGIRHWRLYDSIEELPTNNIAQYYNTNYTEVPQPNQFKTSGNIPTWYEGKNDVQRTLFQSDEVSGRANIAWANRNIDIPQNGLPYHYKDSLNKDKAFYFDYTKIDAFKDSYEYIESGINSLPFANVYTHASFSKLDLENKKLTLWFKSTMSDNPEDVTEVNSQSKVIKYYNKWLVTLEGSVYSYPRLKVVAFYDDKPPTETECEESPAAIVDANYMDPQATGSIRADQRGAERFNVDLGIPTSETLYAQVAANAYLVQHVFQQYEGVCTFKIPVSKTYTLTWTETNGEEEPEEQTREETVTQIVEIERPYSYWAIETWEAYRLQQADLKSGALPGGQVLMTPTGYTPPTANVTKKSQYVVKPVVDEIVLDPEPFSGEEPPEEDFKAEVETKVPKVKVQNDAVVFNGVTLMDGSEREERTTAPTSAPAPGKIGPNTLYRNQLLIPIRVNQAAIPSSGTIDYAMLPNDVGGQGDQTFDIAGINPVTVHTPTVMYPSISNDAAHNQKVTPALDRAALILDRSFTVYVPTSGQHRDIPGYGNRDYATYITRKQVYFPFDVYDNDGTFHAKNQWLDIPVTQQQASYSLPVWVDEGPYTVSFRSFAENYPSSGFTWQDAANVNLAHHLAVNTVPVDVIGRLYDFRLTDIGDFNWERVFRTAKGSATHSPNVYYVGNKGIDGAVMGNRNMAGQSVGGNQLLSLPIRPGSHPEHAYRNWAIKSGYHFKFEVKTKGNMDGLYDGVRIYPTFSFVKKDGTGRIPVDLYYHDYTNKAYFVQIGSAQDKVERTILLNDRMRNVPEKELTDTSQFLSSVHGVTSFLTQAKKPRTIGKLSWLILPYETRTLTGPQLIPSAVSKTRALGSMQTWRGEYSLPATVYAVKRGTNIAEYGRTHGGIREDAPIFLKDGYLIVNFRIETIRDRNLAAPHLRYYPLEGESYPFNNQWQMEGFSRTAADKSGHTFQLKDGDVAFYHADYSSNDDYQSSVPH